MVRCDFALDIDEVRAPALHAEGELEGVDAGFDFRIADLGVPQSIQLGEAGHLIAARRAPREAGRIGQVEHRIAVGLELHALMLGRQEAAVE